MDEKNEKIVPNDAKAENNDFFYKELEALRQRYSAYLRLEKSCSPNTLDAYLRDLERLFVFCRENNTEPQHLTLEQLHQYAAGLHDVVDSRSQARILSGMRSFFKFMLIEKMIPVDISEFIISPKIGVYLPTVLTVDEIDKMENCIDLSKKEGQRNLAIIEVLYGWPTCQRAM